MSQIDAVILNEVKKLAASSGGSDLGYRVTRLVKGAIGRDVTGHLLTANALPGQKLRLVYLSADSSRTVNGISLIIDGYTYWDAVTLGPSSNLRDYKVARGAASDIPGAMIDVVNELECTRLLVTKGAGKTEEPIKYVYEILEPIV